MSPPALLKTVVHDLTMAPALTGLCAGYEGGAWRASALADDLMNALPEFCLTYSELQTFSHETAVSLVRHAAQRVYRTEKFRKRGEFGELMLHVILKQVVQTLPAISKIYYKDASNDTVKGFDAVHVVVEKNGLELWLGEAKFYDDASAAIRDAVASLAAHTQPQYVRGEFYAIKNKIDDSWPHAERLKTLLHDNTSLDEVFAATCIPVLLTYDGPVTARFNTWCAEYTDALTIEFRELHERFSAHQLPTTVRVHLFLVPLRTKQVLLDILDGKLKAWQAI